MNDPQCTPADSGAWPRSRWAPRRDRHRERLLALIGDYLDDRALGVAHPVLDFLFTYYSYRPSQLLRWHPGFGVALAEAGEYADLRGYCRIGPGVGVDPRFLRNRRSAVAAAAQLLSATAGRPARLACFGLHEWAMVYRSAEKRHLAPLRLGPDGTDAVVEALPLRCTHYDAFRFFTPDAAPLNARRLSRADQIRTEQPGCLHSTMDLYRTCYKLSPMIGSELTADCFELALAARELDMRASPYDLSSYGYEPVPVETAEGRALYAREQARLSERAQPLRRELLALCEQLLETSC